MSNFILKRQDDDNSWEQLQDNDGSPAVCIHTHVSIIEELMRDFLKRTITPATLQEHEHIERIVFCEDGKMNLYIK